jgi:hypothetical protein
MYAQSVRRDSMEEKAIYNICNIGPKDIKLIEYIRKLQFGELVIKVQDGLPVMVERAKEKIKL